jgi:single-stranded-DNA-specific exonuclease
MAVEQDYAVASGRSIPGFNIVDAIAASQDLVERYGGHAQAAGFTVRRDAIPEITSRLQAYAGERLPPVDAGPVIEIDTEVRLGELTPDVVDWLETLEPFGPGNRRPVFASLGVIVRETRFMGRSQQHLRLLVEQDGVAVTALAFNQAQYWTAGTTRVDLAYTVTIDSWQGAKTLALRVSHFRLAR